MRTRSDYRIVAIGRNGTRFVVGAGFTAAEAEIVCRRLRRWKTFSDVLLERVADPRTPTAIRPVRPEVLSYTRQFQRMLAALGLL
jgi:hypothetical protein